MGGIRYQTSGRDRKRHHTPIPQTDNVSRRRLASSKDEISWEQLSGFNIANTQFAETLTVVDDPLPCPFVRPTVTVSIIVASP